MSNRTSSSFGATDQRVYITNNRVPVYDFNSEQIRLDLSSGNVKVGITGPVSLAPGTLVGLTGPYVYGGLIGVTGNFTSTVTVGAVEISGNVNLNPNTKVGITGPMTALFDDGTGLIENPLQGKVDIRSGYNSLAVYNFDLENKINPADAPYDLAIQTTVENPITISGGTVSLSSGTKVGLTGPFVYGNYIGVTGSFQSGPISISAGQFVSITGPVGVTGSIDVNNFPSSFSITGLAGVTGNVGVNNFPSSFSITGLAGVTGNVGVNNFPSSFSITGPVGVTGSIDVNNFPSHFGITGVAQTHDASANAMLTTIETDISDGILVKGQDDTGTRYPIYTDANGIQRTEIVTGHIESAKYVFSTDATVITSNAGLNWSLDVRGRRPGWYYMGTPNVAINWYSNTLSVPPTIEFNRVQSLWMIITPDYVADLPKMRLTTTASVWEYTYSTAIIPAIYNGETFLFYYGAKALNLHPSVSPRLMSRTLISGPGANSENVTQISIFTNSNVGTLYQSAGIYDQTNAQQFETIFSDNNDYVEQNNLMNLSYDASLNLKTVVNGLTDPSGNFITSKAVTSGMAVTGDIRGLDTAAYTMAFNQTFATPGYSAINCTNVPTSSSTYTTAYHVRPFKKIIPAGSEGNVLNNVTITSYGISATVSILDANFDRIYGKDSFISYRDSSPSSTNEICIFGVDGGGGFHALLPNGLPTVTNNVGSATPGGRLWSTRADLGMFASLAVKNLGSGSLTGVYLSVLTGQAYSN